MPERVLTVALGPVILNDKGIEMSDITATSTRTGRRTMSTAAQLMALMAENFDGAPQGARKGMFLAAVKQAAPALNLTDKALLMLDQLLAFSKEQDWEAGRRPIVWPSNDLLADVLGVSIRSVQYKRRELENAGLIVVSESPDGKRYGRRGPDQHIVEAYGFDLSPLALNFDKHKAIALELKAARRARQALKRRATIAVKSTRMLVATALEIGLEAVEWSAIEAATQRQSAKLRGVRNVSTLKELVERLESTRCDVEAHFKTQAQVLDNLSTNSIEKDKESPKGANSFVPYTTTTDLSSNKLDTVDTRTQVRQKVSSGFELPDCVVSSTAPNDSMDPIEQTITKYQIKPEQVAALTPLFKDVLPVDRDLTWGDIATAGAKWYKSCGISTDAWQQGMRILGAEASAVAIAIILAKKQEIRSKGGYFRGMVRAAQRGDLNLGPTVYAIHDQLRAQRDGGERIL